MLKYKIIISVLILMPALNGNLITAQNGFVKVENERFLLGGKEFRFFGFNVYYLQSLYANPEKRFIIDDVFSRAALLGVKVIRTWAFNEGDQNPIIISPDNYSEKGFEALDYVVYSAKNHGVKLLLTLANNHSDYGGIPKYISWARERIGGDFSHKDFFSDSEIKSWYKNYLAALLKRVNKFTGTEYRQEEAVFAFELINEASGDGSGGSALYDWYSEMSAYFKSIDSDHLLATGETGYDTSENYYSDINLFYNGSSFLVNGFKETSYLANTSIPFIDFGSFHLYPNGWGLGFEAGNTWIKDHDRIASYFGKPALLGEFGVRRNKTNVYPEYFAFLRNNKNSSALIWHYVHPQLNYKDGYEINEETNPELFAAIKEHIKLLNSTGEPDSAVPDKISLEQNFPNPFNSSTRITYFLPVECYVKLELFSLLGEKVGLLEEGVRSAGYHQVDLSFNSSFLASGTYIYTLRTANYTVSNKMMLLK